MTAFARPLYERFRHPASEFAKFAVVGIAGVFVTNGVYDLLYLHLGVGPVGSTTAATIVAAIGTYSAPGSRSGGIRAGPWRSLLVHPALPKACVACSIADR